jgi:ribosomal protein S18 acetylase RimI-like enzyme
VTDAELRARRIGSQREFLAIVGRGSEGAGVVSGPGWLGSICPIRPDRSIVNAVAYDDAPALLASLGEIAGAYADAGIAAWTVWVPEADREVAAALEVAGHRLDGRPREMGAPLAELDLEPRIELEQEADPDWLDVAEINEAAYARSAGGAYFGPALTGMQGLPYLARLDGRPASCLVVFDVDDDAYVGLVATRTEAQRRGLAGELLRLALREARERGLGTTTLEATAAGAPVYERVGYRDLGVVEMWERRLRHDSAQPG